MFIKLSRYAKNLVLVSATIIVSSILLLGANTLSNINAQSAEEINISIDSTNFAPLTLDPNANQLKVIVAYETVDPQLVNTKINGVMEVLAENGTLVKISSFPNGFDLQENGRIQFATSFTDDAIQSATANVVLMDLNKTDVLSNAVTTEVALNQTDDASAGGS